MVYRRFLFGFFNDALYEDVVWFTTPDDDRLFLMVALVFFAVVMERATGTTPLVVVGYGNGIA